MREHMRSIYDSISTLDYVICPGFLGSPSPPPIWFRDVSPLPDLIKWFYVCESKVLPPLVPVLGMSLDVACQHIVSEGPMASWIRKVQHSNKKEWAVDGIGAPAHEFPHMCWRGDGNSENYTVFYGTSHSNMKSTFPSHPFDHMQQRNIVYIHDHM